MDMFGQRLLRYLTAALGPVTIAGAQFLLSLLLLRVLGLADFGRFSFLLILLQFLTGIWSALFGAPLLVAGLGAGEGGAISRALAATSSLALLPAGGVILAISLLLGLDALAAGCFALWAMLLLLRYFTRAWSLVRQRPFRAMTSDICYGLTLVAGGLWLSFCPLVDIGSVAMLLVASGLAGLAPLLGRSSCRFAGSLGLHEILGYAAVWKRDSRWSLLGVVTTEATVNAQTYIVTALAGAGAFAPIAATALLIRPVTVAINALTEFERARFAHGLRFGERDAIRRAAAHLRWALLAVWCGTLVLALMLLLLWPDLLFHDKFPDGTLWVGASLWFAVVLARAFHAPDGAILLASGKFRTLAMLSSGTAVISLCVVIGLFFALGPVWSIGGILAGEGCFAICLFRAAAAEMATDGKGGKADRGQTDAPEARREVGGVRSDKEGGASSRHSLP